MSIEKLIKSNGGKINESDNNILNEVNISEYSDTEFIKGYLIGLVVGEGSFYINLVREPDRTVPYYISPTFKLNMSDYSSDTVCLLKDYFGCGHLSKFKRKEHWAESYRYKVSKIDSIQRVIIPFFNEYFSSVPVKTDKERAFRIWKYVAERNVDGRSASKEYKIKLVIMAAYSKNKINRITHGKNQVNYEEVINNMKKRFPDQINKHKNDLEQEIEEMISNL